MPNHAINANDMHIQVIVTSLRSSNKVMLDVLNEMDEHRNNIRFLLESKKKTDMTIEIHGVRNFLYKTLPLRAQRNIILFALGKLKLERMLVKYRSFNLTTRILSNQPEKNRPARGNY